MIEFEFLDLFRPNKFNSLVQFTFMVNFACWPHLPLLVFKKISNNLSPKQKTNLKGEALVVPLTIILNENVQRNVKCKIDFIEFKSILKQKPF
jgi:hypothetical protein